MSETYAMQIEYGLKVLDPQRIVTIEIPPDPEPPPFAERVAKKAGAVGWAVACILGGLSASLCLAVALVLAGAGQVSGLAGIPVGVLAFMVWDSRR